MFGSSPSHAPLILAWINGVGLAQARTRLCARSVDTTTIEAADDLVELTPRTAIEEVAGRPEEISLFSWLSAIMARHRK